MSPPILDANSCELLSLSPEQTRRVGMRLGAMLQSGDLLALNGDLGAGKTTLVQGIAAGWGSPDAVSSPTFVLVNVYRRPDGGRLHHLDAYRLSGAEEAWDLDLDTMLMDGPLVVEWAERIAAALPAERLSVHLSWLDETRRRLLVSAHGERYRRLLGQFRQQVFGA
ncbi:MAG: tRNA (adenosine(37)-N6)-threonylcarbamoyltransferase complex ATPase subunit type 1 TsaE [Anaerolineae bacterium]|nr:MAG: tRNA (adenosine(37)-N6)-threonylcarbamoyltransferase complex ATPase subunit type 1 TsaE [Anaerolineae bacterium]